MKTVNDRSTQYDINDIFLKRYSPRALSGEALTDEELMTLFEAARFAPSEFNSQPWRFIYAVRGTEDFDLFMSFLVEFNQSWCKNASVLVVALSKKTSDEGRPSPKNSIGTGAAWENLALQATFMGIIAHGMSGFSEEKVIEDLSIKDDYKVEMMIAIGKKGKIEDLPEALQAREKPNNRKNLDEIVFKGLEGAKKL